MLRSAVEQRAQVLHVAELGRVPVLRELVVDDAAVADDVRAVLGERARDVLEQPRPVPRVDGDLHAEAALDGALLPLTGVKRSGFRFSAFTFGQSSRWIVMPLPSEM